MAVGSGFGAAIAWAVGVFTYTGCFIKCYAADAEPASGVMLMIVAAVMLTAMVICAALAIRGTTEHLKRTAVTSAWVCSLVVAVAAVLGIEGAR